MLNRTKVGYSSGQNVGAVALVFFGLIAVG